jgi:hypothetical protein
MKDTQINHTADENVGHFVTRLFCHENVFVILHDAFLEVFEPHITTYIVVHGYACTNKTLILGYTGVCKTINTVSHNCISRTS